MPEESRILKLDIPKDPMVFLSNMPGLLLDVWNDVQVSEMLHSESLRVKNMGQCNGFHQSLQNICV
jgi:hypothetical protein